MQYKNLHKWDVSPAEAVEIQKNLREKIITENEFGEVRYIAGVDISCNRLSPLGYAVVVVMTFSDLTIVEEKRVEAEIKFPYIPGLLAFREAPILLKAFEKLTIEPALIIFDTYNEPGKNEGDFSYLYSPQGADNVIGAVVRTKSNTKPVFVSIGHKIDLQTAIKFILECRRGYRIPEPTRIAHNLVSKQI